MIRRLQVIVVVLAAALALTTTVSIGSATTAGLRPGTVTGVAQLGAWGGLSGTHRISYLTTDAYGAIVPAAGIVRIPTGPRPAGGWRIVSWAHGTSGLGPSCGLTGSPDLIRGTAPTIDDLNRAGYAVVATDYIGLSPGSPDPHPYLQSRSEASAVIDIVRAARSMFVGLSRSWVVGGSSQGGHAALAAAHLAPTYAPELDFHGTAALAPASNFEQLIPLIRPGATRLPKVTAGSFAAVLAGMSVGQHDVDVSDYLSPLGKRIVEEIGRSCGPEWEGILDGARPDDLLSKPLGDDTFRAAIRKYMGVRAAGHTEPILVIQGLRDTTVPMPLTMALLSEFRSAGTTFDLKLFNAGHSDLRAHGADRTLRDFYTKILAPR
ncbi:alpha/beta fold hydrolase [Gordonia sp. CPCC 206044]|uniref:alpha/beta hydrolase family protein n=1 Tax=Gordonia sp. CPCC 206044 TaxID=3140793 RepID=UPI003AF3E214